MLSALIRAELSYPAVLLAEQLAHQRFVHPGPLVLRMGSLTIRRPQQIGDRTVSRRSEPSSRTALIGEQPNPWDLLQPQDAMSRHRTSFHTFMWRRLYLLLALDRSGTSPVWPKARRGGREPRNLSFDFTRVGVLPVPNVQASPFGSVVTGSITN